MPVHVNADGCGGPGIFAERPELEPPLGFLQYDVGDRHQQQREIEKDALAEQRG
ncbi:hypothetical protein SDC9_164204 [bioreactor metagenome]|uniref:Uncharacterized protein n=1 Tax=bioreactor metagenome TaxID=1076179 RepID=A0A645FR07_9ZZZZ